MSSTISVSVRSVVVTMALVVGLMAAYLLGSSTRGTPAQAAEAPTNRPVRTITMTGTGDATGVPNQLSFKLSVGNTAEDVATAMDRSSRTMANVVAVLKRNGVEKKDTQTTGLSINPVYRYDDNQPPVVTGYRVRQTVGVLVRSLRGSGKAVSAAIAAGGDSSRISDLDLEIGDVDGLLAQARDRAVDEATAKARQYAEAIGQDLGKVVTLREVRATPASRPANALADLTMAAARTPYRTVPIRAGSERLDVEVAVVWELG